MRYDPPFHKTNGLVPIIVVAIGLILFPFVFTDTFSRHLLVLVFVYAMVAVSWDLTLGFGGLVNFAHVAMFACGIYAYAILAKTLGVSPWLAIPAAGVVAMILAVAITLPILRLDGIYVILVTLAFSQLLYQVVISQSDLTGGTVGMVTLPSLKLFGYKFIKDGKIGYYFTGLLLLAASVTVIYWVIRSRIGRAIVALRDHKYYAQSRGVSEARTRIYAMAISAFISGVAGGFYGSYVRVASPDAFGIGFLTIVLSILLVGGVGSLWGPVIAAFVITLLAESLANLGPWREILIAILIILIMVFYPGGLWAAVQELREIVDVRRSALTAWFNRRRYKGRRQELLNVEEKYIETDHGTIAVADSGGDKPVLLCLHGNSSSKEVFQYQFESYRDRFRVIAYDLPGHGVSTNADPETSYNVAAYADAAEQILEQLEASEPIVIGWSLGGYVGLELAARANVKVRGLVITGTSPLNIVPDDFGAGYNADSHMILAGKHFLSPTETKNFVTSAVAPLTEESAYLHKAMPRTDGRARLYMITKINVTDWPRQARMLREGKIPFAIMNGPEDPFLNHQYIADWPYGNIWTGKPNDIPGGLHTPFFNKPKEFNAEFDRFLKEACGF
ncbi:MAG: alpha/beta fold hydrolase [Proteobacteria bacterium]|nr:alpha/beta fold hydrolase [Pseudomonadota bacterium]